MPVELRKRKAPQPPPAPTPAAKKAGKAAKQAAAPSKAAKKAPAQAKEADTEEDELLKQQQEEPKEPKQPKQQEEEPKQQQKQENEEPKQQKQAAKVAVGDVIDLEGFGGEVETNDGHKTTLKKLVADSKSGVVLFTYPKASTPGCTNQACLFRDAYEPLTADGLSIYGLSSDSPKANTSFREKQRLPYPLLCDPQATLIAAIGLKKQPKGTQRGVFVIDSKAKVLVAEPGGPAATVERVKQLVQELKG